jgi:hypothetical protein
MEAADWALLSDEEPLECRISKLDLRLEGFSRRRASIGSPCLSGDLIGAHAFNVFIFEVISAFFESTSRPIRDHALVFLNLMKYNFSHA